MDKAYMTFEDIPAPPLPKCRVCGGYGWNYPPGGRSAQRCPSCGGDKISRKPSDYENKRDMPPPPR